MPTGQETQRPAMNEPKKETVRIVLPPRRDGKPGAANPREAAMINLPPKPLPTVAGAPPTMPAPPRPAAPVAAGAVVPPPPPRPFSMPVIPKPGMPTAPTAVPAPAATAATPPPPPKPVGVAPVPVPKPPVAAVATGTQAGRGGTRGYAEAACISSRARTAKSSDAGRAGSRCAQAASTGADRGRSQNSCARRAKASHACRSCCWCTQTSGTCGSRRSQACSSSGTVGSCCFAGHPGRRSSTSTKPGDCPQTTRTCLTFRAEAARTSRVGRA